MHVKHSLTRPAERAPTPHPTRPRTIAIIKRPDVKTIVISIENSAARVLATHNSSVTTAARRDALHQQLRRLGPRVGHYALHPIYGNAAIVAQCRQF